MVVRNECGGKEDEQKCEGGLRAEGSRSSCSTLKVTKGHDDGMHSRHFVCMGVRMTFTVLHAGFGCVLWQNRSPDFSFPFPSTLLCTLPPLSCIPWRIPAPKACDPCECALLARLLLAR